MKSFGITGGIGSGKTVVCSVFEAFGIPVYRTDERAKEMYGIEGVRKSLVNRFGREIYLSGKINKRLLADLIFKDRSKLDYINRLIHPQVARDFLMWAQENKDCPALAMESAILFESGFDRYVDYTLSVTASLDKRINRVMRRDAASRREVLERMENQMKEEEKIGRSDFVIDNEGSDPLLPQIEKILHLTVNI